MIAQLGDAATNTKVATTVGTSVLAIPAVTEAVASGTGLATSAVIPVIGSIIAGVGIALTAWLNRAGPKQKIATTKIVDEAEPVLKQNLQAWLDGPQTQDLKDYHLDVFNQVWNRVREICGNQQYGNPGKNCIGDRQRGGKWDWFSYYYDPIANTPAKTVVDQTTGILQNALNQTFRDSINPGWVIGGLALLGLIFTDFGDK